MAASVSGCSSPARCSSAPAPRFPSPTGPFRITAPWFRSPGRAAVSRPVKPLLNPQVSARPGRRIGVIDFMRPWQRRVVTPYLESIKHRECRTVNTIAELTGHADRSLLIVEDDKPFLERLSRAMETRGFTVTSCDSVSEGLAQIVRAAPAFGVVGWGLGGGNGFEGVSALRRRGPAAGGLVLTGYGNSPTAVTAVKMGAVDYLSKPADADDVVAALLASGTEKSEPPHNPMSADRVRWEHIQRIYEMCNRNVSETPPRLNIHPPPPQPTLAHP